MRLETTTRKIYKFNELSEEAQGKAIEDHRQFIAEDNPWHDERVDTLNAFEKIFPVKVKDWEYGYHNFINFEFTEDEDHEELTGWRLVAYLWNNYQDKLWKGKYYSTPGYYDENKKYHYKFRHSKIILDNSCVLTGYCMDDDILKEIYQYMNKPDSRNFKELLYDCLQEWVFAANQDYEYQMSDEAIKENIEANEYEFTENGELA